MSYDPNQSYGYTASPNYYVEDTDEFEYADSDTFSDPQPVMQVPQNVNELYSRSDIGMPTQRQVMTNQMAYRPNQTRYMQQCYYEGIPPSESTRLLTAVPYQDYIQVFDPRTRHYCPMASSYHDSPYRGSHTVSVTPLQSALPRVYQAAAHGGGVQKQQPMKRFPVKVGTPKYYRKAPPNTVYKRPSTLCLPVASQPDPAVHRKHKKINMDVQGLQNLAFTADTIDTQQLRKPNETILNEHKVGSEGDFSLPVVSPSKLEDMFSQMEKEAADTSQVNTQGDMVKIAKLLRPRVPSSIRAKQEKKGRSYIIKTEPAKEKAAEEENIEKTQDADEGDSATDSIERLLNQLKKCEMAVCGDVVDKIILNCEKENVEDADDTKEDDKMKKSFNYEDISQQMSKSKSEMKAFEHDVDNERVGRSHDIARRVNLSVSATRSFVSRPTLDDQCALELHRSKSYIVNLIDRALSKELGTVPSRRLYNEFDDMNPKKAIDTMNRHVCGKCDKEFSLEITSALTDSIISNATAPEAMENNHLPSPSSSSKGKICCCNGEEPTYIKQLKQLRWGHLKHIQREVRRLEDLERFLDSCSLNPISES